MSKTSSLPNIISWSILTSIVVAVNQGLTTSSLQNYTVIGSAADITIMTFEKFGYNMS